MGPCAGETIPAFDGCNDGIDSVCDGKINDPPDQDGDGWTACQGDCCDSLADGRASPNLVNPCTFEVAGNMVDDCDGTVDNALSGCDVGLPSR